MSEWFLIKNTPINIAIEHHTKCSENFIDPYVTNGKILVSIIKILKRSYSDTKFKLLEVFNVSVVSNISSWNWCGGM